MAINISETVKKCSVCGKWKVTAYEPDYPILNDSCFPQTCTTTFLLTCDRIYSEVLLWGFMADWRRIQYECSRN